jgi:hypothetical protein
MKAIAEYFRDLAAGDRYFGAEPPTPDAAMLHQIAEREIQRRVEAKIQDNGVVLRASDQPETAPVVSAPSVSAPSQIAAPVVAEAAVPAIMPVAVETPVAVEPSVSPASAPATETVVEKLSRLRSEIAAQPVAVAAAQTSPVVSFAIPDYAEDQDADTVDGAALADFLPEYLVRDALTDTAGPSAAVTSYAIPDFAEDDYAEDQDADTVDTAALSDFLPEDLASEALADLPEDVVEDAPVEELRTEAPMMAEVAEAAAEEMDAIDLSDADLSAMMAAAQAPEALAEEEPVDLADVDLSAVMAEAAHDSEPDAADDLSANAEDLPESLLAALAGEPDAEAPVEKAQDTLAAQFDDAELAEADHGEASSDADADRLNASLEAVMGASAAAEQTVESDEAAETIWAETWAETSEDVAVSEVASGVAEEPVLNAVQDDLPATEAEETLQSAPMVAPNDTELRPGAAEKLQRARARVIRIRKSDDTGVPAVKTETVAEDAPATSSAFAEVEEATESGLSPLLSAADEAELQRELAALRRGEADNDGDVAGLSQLTQQQDSRKGFDGPSADEALSRLMKQTDNEMEGSETKRRQSAIQHLKAAVAATVADRKVTGEKAGETETVSRLARYRSDLAMAVKAALPGGRGAATGERPAPLVLVSEQRIDRPRPPVGQSGATGSAPAPIRPRRVTSGGMGMATAADLDLNEDDEDETGDDAANMFGDSGGFSDFVERIGATSFEQILEASAAYLAGVEGRPHFSRPQLMRHLTAVVPQGSFQREDGLRSFGTLLRDGRIAKVRRGQFTLSEESAYLAEARKLAQ